MNIMWRPVEEEVDALVSFSRSVSYPMIRSIRWHHRRVDFEGAGHVERARQKLTYWLDDGAARYVVRYEFPHQRWILEGLDDSAFADPGPGLPPDAF
jgi:hypothetical protein